MQIEKTAPDSGLGIYAMSREVKDRHDWRLAISEAHAMIAWLNEVNGSFSGTHSLAYAMAHCQVAPIESPLRLFVVDKSLVEGNSSPEGNQTLENTFFEGQAIFNAEILDAPENITKDVPRRVAVRDPDDASKVSVQVIVEPRTLENLISVPEACMSFPHKKAKNMMRYYEIKVRYDYMDSKGRIKSFKGIVKGLKAHILQHETDHFQAKNIFYP